MARRKPTKRCARPISSAVDVPAANTAALAARANESQARIRELFSRTDGTESMSGLRKEMMDTMEKNVGIYRTEAGYTLSIPAGRAAALHHTSYAFDNTLAKFGNDQIQHRTTKHCVA